MRLALLLLLLAGQAAAIKPPVKTRRDAKAQVRMAGASVDPDKALRASAAPDAESARAFGEFNKGNGGKWRIRYNPRTGAPEALVEGEARPRSYRAQSAAAALASPEATAAAFLREVAGLLKLDPADLVVEKVSRGDGHSHVLYSQRYRGLPVESSRVKVHVGPDGSIIGLHSRYEPGLTLDPTPAIPAQAAADAVLRDSGLPGSEPKLVVFPNEAAGRAQLAWKLTARGKFALWRYYVDARTGEVLFRYNDLRYQCNTTGTVRGQVYDLDPSTTPALNARPFANQYVYVGTNASPAITEGDGSYCHAATGKITTSLQGPYVRVSNFRGPSAHHDNGSGAWFTQATLRSSAHPYPDNADVTDTVDLSSVLPADTVKVGPVFSAFEVGRVDDGIDIGDNDQLELLDAAGKPIAAYVGARGAFNAAAVHGTKYGLRLRSNGSGRQYGYDISVSSYLRLSSPNTLGADSNLTWVTTHTATGGRAELSIFYHLNKMRDYFLGGVNKSSAAYLSNPVVASAYFGPNFNGAFYNPEFDNLNFGDLSASNPQDVLGDDSTVVRHEYTHYVVEKIWSIQNYGQAGAVSEAIADYFAGSSLDTGSIGKYYNVSQGFGVPLRELDCRGQPTTCLTLGTNFNWTGEIHDDSVPLGQTFWDIRIDVIGLLGYANGKACADGMVFQSLLFFPESFAEFYDAMRRSAGLVSACAPQLAAVTSQVQTRFADHGLIPPTSDSFEGGRGNNGFETAVDITTYPSVSATISPAADLDFYSFAAGPGPLQIALSLPADGSFYKAYSLFLFSKTHPGQPLAQAHPPYDGFDTFGGACEAHNCTTSAPSVVLTYHVTEPGLYYVQVGGGLSTGGSNSGVNSLVPYTLTVSYEKAGALSAGIVTASYDNDLINYSVNVTSFVRTQNFAFAYAQLRDHAHNALPGTDTRQPGSYLAALPATNALGKITGSVRLEPGFAARYPAAGTVHLEVFAYNVDPDNVQVSTVSMGLSNGLNLTANGSGLKAFNNVFNPLRGGRATVRYDVQGAGRVTLRLYTLAGDHVLTLFDGEVLPGRGSVDWDGRNLAGSVVASGIYVLHAKGPGLDKRQKIVVVK